MWRGDGDRSRPHGKSYLLPCITGDQLDRRRVSSGAVIQNSTMFVFASVSICGVTCSNNGYGSSAMTLDIGDALVIEAPCFVVYSYLAYASDNVLRHGDMETWRIKIFITDGQSECDQRNKFLDTLRNNYEYKFSHFTAR